MPGDGGDGALDGLGQVGVDHVGRGTPIGGGDGHHRVVDIGQFAHRQVAQGGQPEDHDQKACDRRQHRAAHRKFRQRHDGCSARAAAAVAASSVQDVERRAVAHPLQAAHDHRLARLQPREHGDAPVAALPGLDDALPRGAVIGDKDIGLGRLKDDRLFGDGDFGSSSDSTRVSDRNMPAGSVLSGLGITARVRKARLTGSIRLSTAVTVPSKRAVGKGGAARGHGLAAAHLREHGLGQRELHLDLGQIVEPGEHLPVRDARAHVVIGQPHNAREGRGDAAILQPAAARSMSACASASRAVASSSAACDTALVRLQRADAVERLALFGQHRLGLRQIGALDAVIEPRQHIARPRPACRG